MFAWNTTGQASPSQQVLIGINIKNGLVFILLKISVSFAISLSISDSSIPTAAARAKYGSSKLLDEQPNRFSCTLVGCILEIFVEIQ